VPLVAVVLDLYLIRSSQQVAEILLESVPP
jgi:hypothetical protein